MSELDLETEFQQWAIAERQHDYDFGVMIAHQKLELTEAAFNAHYTSGIKNLAKRTTPKRAAVVGEALAAELLEERRQAIAGMMVRSLIFTALLTGVSITVGFPVFMSLLSCLGLSVPMAAITDKRVK